MQLLLREGHDVTFRDPYAPLPSCRVSQILAASFARNRRFRDFLKFGTFDGCASGSELANTPSPLGAYSLPLTFTQKQTAVDPACCFVFEYRFGDIWYPRGVTPSPRPRRAQELVHRAALGGVLRQSSNCPITRRIRCRRERQELRRVRRCRLRRIGRVRRPSPRRRLPCRDTPLYLAAQYGETGAIAELLLRGGQGTSGYTRYSGIWVLGADGADGAARTRPRRGRSDQTHLGSAVRCAAQPNRKPQQPRARRRTPKQFAERQGRLAEYEAGESQVHSARRLTAPAHSAPHPSPRCWCRRMCRRCSPSALADPAGREATAHAALPL